MSKSKAHRSRLCFFRNVLRAKFVSSMHKCCITCRLHCSPIIQAHAALPTPSNFRVRSDCKQRFCPDKAKTRNKLMRCSLVESLHRKIWFAWGTLSEGDRRRPHSLLPSCLRDRWVTFWLDGVKNAMCFTFLILIFRSTLTNSSMLLSGFCLRPLRLLKPNRNPCQSQVTSLFRTASS